jgi:4-hydroxybenzoate polyprenyltransferase
MDRTRNRPLPSGRLQPVEVLIFGVIMALAGLAYLALTVRQSLAILSAGFALTSYVFLYTPLRRKTTLNTLVGAVSGAMPPVIGWTAVAADAEGVPGLLADPTGVDACGGSVEIMARTTVKLAPSILAADFARRGEQGADAGKATKDRIHIGQRS